MLRTPPGASIIIAASLSVISAGCLSFHARATQSREIAHPLVPGQGLFLEGQNGRIDVQPGAGEEVKLLYTITCRARTQESAAEGLALVQPIVDAAGGRLAIRFDPPRSFRRSYQVDLRAWVPPRTDLSLASSNGLITVEAMEGRIEARTSNGRVVAHDVASDGVVFSTSNADIIAERVQGPLEVSTTNGSIRLRECSGPIQARSSNGRVEIDASSGLEGGLTATTSNGRIRCLFPAEFSGELDARTSNAGVRCDFPLSGGGFERGRRRARGTIGQGGPSVRLSTSNGEVEVRAAGKAAAPRPAITPASQEAPSPGGIRQV